MDEAQRLNELLEQHAPAAARCLSPLGRKAAFPRGIPFQAAEARGTEINATIGQVTDGHGQPLPLPEFAAELMNLDDRTSFLYSPQDGHGTLRLLWAERQDRLSGGAVGARSEPIVTHGLSQGVSLAADLFADPETVVVVPEPSWENYALIFSMRAGAEVRAYPFFNEGRFNVEGLGAVLGGLHGRKAVIVLNFPSNPTGYAPSPAEVAQIVRVVTAHPGPAVALCDDAYQGMIYDEGCMTRSPFWDLLEAHDPERLFPIKLDGATKELFFFPGRVGFMIHAGGNEVDDAIRSKVKYVGRGTVGGPPGPSQALVQKALQSGQLDASIAARLAILRGRYRVLRGELAALSTDRLTPLPFNSGCFVTVRVDPSIDVEELRLRLIRDHSVGVVVMPKINALRIAYCSIAESALPELVRRLGEAVTA